jgi:hypothetical protein
MPNTPRSALAAWIAVFDGDGTSQMKREKLSIMTMM